LETLEDLFPLAGLALALGVLIGACGLWGVLSIRRRFSSSSGTRENAFTFMSEQASKSPFRPSFLKIERAQRHIQELEDVITEWFAKDPVTFRTTPRPHVPIPPPPDAPEELKGKKWFAMAFDMEFRQQPVPEVTAAILGDIFHNLRSSLDLMACALAREVSGTDNEVSFRSPLARMKSTR
jgi:hypothetical protein